MPEGKPEFLTVRELAAFLRVKERKVYALAASGEIPCSRATGKLIFPRAAVEAWVSRHSSGTAMAAAAPVERPLVFVGSHDPLLDWALRESRSGLASFFDGSLDGLARLRDGQAVAAGVHLYESEPEDWNRDHVEAELPGQPVVLLEWAWRDRGFIVAEGNPKKISSFRSLPGKRFVPRQAEAGSQVLFEALLDRERIERGSIDVIAPAARSEADVAVAVSEGKADAGFGLAGVAHQFRLGFVPLLRERYDIVVFRRAYFEPAFQTFIEFCRGSAFRARAAELGGYDLSGFGRVHYNAA
jgi:putative molybdopterin biosynthesis protein